MERAHHSSSAGCSSARCTDAHRSASSASRRAPQIAWQVLLRLFYRWCADAFGRSWTGRAPVVHGSTSARAARELHWKTCENSRATFDQRPGVFASQEALSAFRAHCTARSKQVFQSPQTSSCPHISQVESQLSTWVNLRTLYWVCCFQRVSHARIPPAGCVRLRCTAY